MRVFFEAFALGMILGAAFAIGKDTWGWIACRYFPKFRADRTVMTISIDAEEAMASLATLKTALDDVAASGAVDITAKP